jgi:uncharacterized membrane protein YkgB
MTDKHHIIANPWQTAYTIWGSNALLSTIIYIAALGFFGGNVSIEFGLLVGLISAMISLPVLVALRWALPPLLTLKLQSQRVVSVGVLVVLLFLLLAMPFSMACSIGADDANSVQLNWSEVGGILFFASPCLLGALVATGYTCRALLFRPDFLQ